MRDVWLGCLVQARESKSGEREDSKDISGWGLGRAKLAAVFLLFIAVEVGVWGCGFPHFQDNPSCLGWVQEHPPGVSRLIKAQPCLQVTQVMNPLQGACWL